MAKQNPKYRGIYAYNAANKPPTGTPAPLTKSNPKYRGIYTYDPTQKPTGVALDGQTQALGLPEDGETLLAERPEGDPLDPDLLRGAPLPTSDPKSDHIVNDNDGDGKDDGLKFGEAQKAPKKDEKKK